MKLFLGEFAWEPSGKEQTVIMAETIERAKEIIKKEFPGIDTFINSEPISSQVSVCFLQEVEFDEEGVVYTGYHCC